MGFTYDLPDSGAVFNTLKALLLSKNENKLYEIIINSDLILLHMNNTLVIMVGGEMGCIRRNSYFCLASS